MRPEVISYAELAVSSKAHKDGIGKKRKSNQLSKGRSIGSGSSNPDNQATQEELYLSDEIDEITEAIYAKTVQKCGNSKQWEEWAEEVSVIAEKHIVQIKAILTDKNNTAQIQAFEQFSGSPFVENNPVSQAIKPVLSALSVDTNWQDKKELQHFYDRVEMKIKGIEKLRARQALIKDLYDNFFNKAFSKMAEKLGIVYTPIRVVDFILHSVECVMNKEFSGCLKDNGVHIFDPFTGTGTFITRLLQSCIIPPENLADKYQNDIHANEIVPLAYYIAAVNIESVFYDEMKKYNARHSVSTRHIELREESRMIEKDSSPTAQNDGVETARNDGVENNETAYLPFNCICLTDTFESHDYDLDRQPENLERIKRQKEQEIRVIIGNPPYATIDKGRYPALDNLVDKTYGQTKAATMSLFDAYIYAIRWASDRIGEKGVIVFVTNGGWVDSNSADGLRKCLADEFSSLYIFHLRGNARTQGERRRKEKDNIFGQGTRTPVVISILVKNPSSAPTRHSPLREESRMIEKDSSLDAQNDGRGKIYFHDIGDYLSRDEKLKIIADFKDINGITANNGWQEIIPESQTHLTIGVSKETQILIAISP